MKIEAIAKFVYGFFGTVFLIGGATVMLFHTGLLPGPVQNLSGPMIDTIPFMLFLLIGLLRWQSERRFATEASK